MAPRSRVLLPLTDLCYNVWGSGQEILRICIITTPNPVLDGPVFCWVKNHGIQQINQCEILQKEGGREPWHVVM